MPSFTRPSELEIAYFAGLFDGEGCVTLHRKLRKRGSPCYELNLQLAGTYWPVLEKIQRIWGFGQVTTESFESRPNRKPCWHWVVYGQKALFVLVTIRPYICVKKSDAEIGIAFQKWKTKDVSVWGRSRRPEYSYVQETKLKELLAELRQVNLDETVYKRLEEILGQQSCLFDSSSL